MSEESFQNKKEELAELNPDMFFCDGLEPALIGAVQIFNKVVSLYDYDKCIDHLIDRDGSDYESVVEYLEFNTLGAYVGENTPGFLIRTQSFYEDVIYPHGAKLPLLALSNEERVKIFKDFCTNCGAHEAGGNACRCGEDD